jgi:hypothetical protein
MPARVFKDSSPFEGQLNVVATLAGDVIQASISELRQRDKLTIALRSALRMGVSIDELSDSSGLTVAEIRRRIASELMIEDDTDELAGIR